MIDKKKLRPMRYCILKTPKILREQAKDVFSPVQKTAVQKSNKALFREYRDDQSQLRMS